MISTNLQGVAELVIRQAQRQGYILPRQVRTVLSGAGVCESLWKDVLAVARPSLVYRKGRYYYTAPVSDRVRQEQVQQRGIQQAIREIIRHHRGAARIERREDDRIEFVQPVKVRTEDGREFTLLTRDLSATGIRLIGARRFLGQKIRVIIPIADGTKTREFLVRILWTCAVGDDLVENGGTFLEVADSAYLSADSAASTPTNGA
ncbi:MAG TPA: PilZ domain-containing protein [Gemmataceae bacterium]|nr:PilZ domain-containing protein [Gemmataceae bacterium]